MRKENAGVENLSMSDNYFNLLNLVPKFEIDKENLYSNYIKLQQVFHPDKQQNKSKSEKLVTMEYAAKINKAYQILNDDKKRAEYLLFLEGIIINQEENNNIQPDSLMLNEILEMSENPEGYDISLMKTECWEAFQNSYAEGNLQTAAQFIIKLQYLNKIKSTSPDSQ